MSTAPTTPGGPPGRRPPSPRHARLVPALRHLGGVEQFERGACGREVARAERWEQTGMWPRCGRSAASVCGPASGWPSTARTDAVDWPAASRARSWGERKASGNATTTSRTRTGSSTRRRRAGRGQYGHRPQAGGRPRRIAAARVERGRLPTARGRPAGAARRGGRPVHAASTSRGSPPAPGRARRPDDIDLRLGDVPDNVFVDGVVDDGEVGDARAGRLVDPDAGGTGDRRRTWSATSRRSTVRRERRGGGVHIVASRRPTRPSSARRPSGPPRS